MAEPDSDALQARITALYQRVAALPVPPGSFPMVDSFLGTGSPTGYALVLDRLGEARKSLNASELATGERLYYEAQSRFEWCEKTSDWISKRMLLGWVPRWAVGVLYLIVWLIIVAVIAESESDWKLVQVPVPFLFWGVAGGVTAGLFGIWIHTARADFDPQYLPWYAVKPLIGGVSGALVFLMAELIKSGVEAEEKELYFAAFVLGFFEATVIKVLILVSDQVLALIQAAFGQRMPRPG